MKKFCRILGRCALGAFLLAAVYSILVAAGGLLPAPPVVPEGPMFVPELSQEQEERFAELKKRYGSVHLTVMSKKPFTVTNSAGNTAWVDPRGDVTGDLKVYYAYRYETAYDGGAYTVGIEVCGSEEIIVDLERQQAELSTGWGKGRWGPTLLCEVSSDAMDVITLYPDRRIQIVDGHRSGRNYTVQIKGNDGSRSVGMGCQGRIRGSQQFAFPARNQIQLEGETEKWTLIYQEAPVNYTESWTVPTPKARITALAPAEEKRFAVEAVP